MFFTIALVLLAAWLLGLINSYTFGGLIHVFLAVAIVMFAVDAILARRAQQPRRGRVATTRKPSVSPRRSARPR